MQTKKWTFGHSGNQQGPAPLLFCVIPSGVCGAEGPRFFFCNFERSEKSRRTLLRPAQVARTYARAIPRCAQDDAKKQARALHAEPSPTSRQAAGRRVSVAPPVKKRAGEN